MFPTECLGRLMNASMCDFIIRSKNFAKDDRIEESLQLTGLREF